jgi:hypothetical protein
MALRRGLIELLSAGVQSPSRVTTGRVRAYRSGRSPTAWVALPRRSRPTSTIQQERRYGRSKRDTRACAAAAARARGRATAKVTPTRTASAAILARSSPRWTRERVLEAMGAWRARYGRLPSSYDWSRTHARRRGGEALERLAGGAGPAASVVTDLFGAAAHTAVSRQDIGVAAPQSDIRTPKT